MHLKENDTFPSLDENYSISRKERSDERPSLTMLS